MNRKQLVLSLLAAALAANLAACAGGRLRLPSEVRLEQQPGLAFLERKSGRIVYVGTDGNIYVTDQGGVSRTKITGDAQLSGQFYHVYRMPAWSPDGSQIAFVGESGSLDGSTPTDVALYTVPREGGVLTEAYNSDENLPFYLHWSPDGKYVSFLSSNRNERTFELQAVSADGSGHPFALESTAPIYHSWAPDSASVLMHVGGEGPDALLGAVELDSPAASDETELEPLPYLPGTFQAPAWSPDGSHTLFATSGGEGKDSLVVADAQGRQPRVVAEYSGKIAFDWSPNGRYVAYIVSHGADTRRGPTIGLSGSLYLYDLRSNETTTLREDEDVLAFFWSPNSKRLAFFVRRPVETEEAGSVTLLDLNMAVTRSGEVYKLLTFLPPEDFLRMLGFFDQVQRSATLWSPDSQNVVFAAYGQEDRPFIAVMHASGSLQPRGIAEGTLAFWSRK